jgi:thiamine-phosphate pyrophosphorylase
LGYVTLASERSSVPVFVTGGVTPERIPALAGAGARHFVVVRYLTQAADPRAAAQALRAAIDLAWSTAPTAP